MLSAVLIVCCAVGSIWAADKNGYLAVTGPCNLTFPQDHGSHPGFRTEWWYYTGNLASEAGSRYGFQLTFFRSQISPPGADQHWPKPASKWRTQQIYLAHAAVSDLSAERHLAVDDVVRGALGLAGVDRNQSKITTVHLKNWYAKIGSGIHAIKMFSDSFAFDLQLTPEKNPVLHGQAGYSRKGGSPDSASCYYSFTRTSIVIRFVRSMLLCARFSTICASIGTLSKRPSMYRNTARACWRSEAITAKVPRSPGASRQL